MKKMSKMSKWQQLGTRICCWNVEMLKCWNVILGTCLATLLFMIVCHAVMSCCQVMLSYIKCLCWSLGHAEQLLFSCLCSKVTVYDCLSCCHVMLSCCHVILSCCHMSIAYIDHILLYKYDIFFHGNGNMKANWYCGYFIWYLVPFMRYWMLLGCYCLILVDNRVL